MNEIGFLKVLSIKLSLNIYLKNHSLLNGRKTTLFKLLVIMRTLSKNIDDHVKINLKIRIKVS